MWPQRKEREIVGEPRYDAGTLRKVATLAARLQDAEQETLTAREVEAIGAEVGLDAAFIRRALKGVGGGPAKSARGRRPRGRPFGDIASLLYWMLCGLLVYLYPTHERHIILTFLLLMGGGLLLLTAATKQNFMSKWLSWALGSICLTATVALASDFLGFLSERGAAVVIQWVLSPALIILAVRLGLYEDWCRRRAPRSRTALIEQIVTLQQQLDTLHQQLDAQKQHRTFLSVDVVGSSEMKRSASELAVEHSFGQYRAWVEGVVHAHGGEMQSAAGDGVMAIFPTDAGALRAARQLQEELPEFNQAHNRLPQPFRIRCGVSAGEVAIEEGMPLGHLQSPVIDRAAALQKRAEPGDIALSGEVEAGALLELGNLTPLPEPIAGEPAFSWRP